MFWSTRLNLQLLVCLDWLQQLFLFNAIMKSKSCISWWWSVEYCWNQLLQQAVSPQEVCGCCPFPASHLDSICLKCLCRGPYSLQSAGHEWYWKDFIFWLCLLSMLNSFEFIFMLWWKLHVLNSFQKCYWFWIFVLIFTDDWQFQRGSFSFFLGDPIHFEISVFIGNHVSLRVYVDNCVATATPDSQAALRYDFIENYGWAPQPSPKLRHRQLFVNHPHFQRLLPFLLINRCLADTLLTNSSSHFLPRVDDHKLRFQLEAFRFYHESNNQVGFLILKASRQI